MSKQLREVWCWLVISASLAVVAYTFTGCAGEMRQVKAAAADVQRVVDSACALADALDIETGAVKEARKLCAERSEPPWKILEAVAACEFEVR